MPISTSSIRQALESSGAHQPDWSNVLAEILRLFDCTTGTIHALDRTRNLLLLKAHKGIPEVLLPKVSTIPVGKGMAGIAAQRKEPVQVCNLQTDESGVAKPSAKETKVEGSITVPLMLRGELFGTLGIAKPTSYEFSKKEIASLEEIGQAISERLSYEKHE
jgi:putative methionine-R-sulfoxide reductase with GAF domain